MSKFHGNVGYGVAIEKYPGVWEEEMVERPYYGDVVKNRMNIQQSAVINPGITINNTISIVTDKFARENAFSIRYVTYLGKKWCVTSIEEAYPRILLTLGGVYNGN